MEIGICSAWLNFLQCRLSPLADETALFHETPGLSDLLREFTERYVLESASYGRRALPPTFCLLTLLRLDGSLELGVTMNCVSIMSAIRCGNHVQHRHFVKASARKYTIFTESLR